METGGVLSHGAIVAREFGLPGVAGLPGIVQQIKTRWVYLPSPLLPELVTKADTIEEALENVRDALAAVVEAY